MCEYCDNFVKESDYPDFVNIMQIKKNLVDGMVEQVIEVYIGSRNGSPVLKLWNSYELRNFEGTDELEKEMPIKYCPFCGLNLDKAREEFEQS